MTVRLKRLMRASPKGPKRGFVIALSGVDCSGKSTQRRRLLETLRNEGREPIHVWSRAGYSKRLRFLRKISNVVRGRRDKQRAEKVAPKPGLYPRRASTLPNPIHRRIWLSLALLDLLWLYAVKIRFWKQRGRLVVCDRYLLDALVDFRVNFPDDRVEHSVLGRLLRRWAVKPDVAICLVIPVDESIRRSKAKSRYHWETESVLAARLEQYRAVAEELGVHVLNGAQAAEAVAAAVSANIGDARVQAAPCSNHFVSR